MYIFSYDWYSVMDLKCKLGLIYLLAFYFFFMNIRIFAFLKFNTNLNFNLLNSQTTIQPTFTISIVAISTLKYTLQQWNIKARDEIKFC